jgi:chromosome segregation ATPase
MKESTEARVLGTLDLNCDSSQLLPRLPRQAVFTHSSPDCSFSADCIGQQADLEELTEKFGKLEAKLNKTKAAKASEERHSSVLKKEVARLEGKLGDLKGTSAKQQKDLQGAKATIGRLEAQTFRLEEELSANQKKLKSISKAQLTLAAQLKEQETARREAEERTEADIVLLQDANARVRALELDNSFLREITERLKTDVTWLEDERDDLLNSSVMREEKTDAETRAYITKLEDERRSLECRLKEAMFYKSSRVTFEGGSLEDEFAEISKDNEASFLDDSDHLSPRYFLQDDRTQHSFTVTTDKPSEAELLAKVSDLELKLKKVVSDLQVEKEYVDELTQLRQARQPTTQRVAQHSLAVKSKGGVRAVSQRLLSWFNC